MLNLFTRAKTLRLFLMMVVTASLLGACASMPGKKDSDGGSSMSVRDRLARIKETGTSKVDEAEKGTEDSEKEQAEGEQAEDQQSDALFERDDGADETIEEQDSASQEEKGDVDEEPYELVSTYTLPPAIPRTRVQPEVDRETRALYKDALKSMEKGMENKEFDEAISLFEQVEQRNPQLSGPRTNIGLIYMHQENLEEAEKAFTKALEINNENEFAHFNLALCYKEQGKFAQAKESYINAIKLEPGYAEAHYNMGVLAELYLQDMELAIKAFEYYRLAHRKQDKEVDIWLTDLRARVKQEREYQQQLQAYEQAKAAQEAGEAPAEGSETGESEANEVTESADAAEAESDQTEISEEAPGTEEQATSGPESPAEQPAEAAPENPESTVEQPSETNAENQASEAETTEVTDDQIEPTGQTEQTNVEGEAQ